MLSNNKAMLISAKHPGRGLPRGGPEFGLLREDTYPKCKTIHNIYQSYLCKGGYHVDLYMATRDNGFPHNC
jgi:hypothetical protein